MSVINIAGNSFLTNDLVENVWNDYISDKPTFLNHVTIEEKKIPPTGIGSFSYNLPSYTSTPIITANNVIPAPSSYFSPTQTMNWSSEDALAASNTISIADIPLYITHKEYQMQYIKAPLHTMMSNFAINFANKLTSITNQPLWQPILLSFPKVPFYLQQTKRFNDLISSWYNSKTTSVSYPAGAGQILKFIPDLCDLGGWALHTCSQYASFMGYQNAELAMSPAMYSAIAMEQSTGSSTAPYLEGRGYNDMAGGYNNGILNTYTMEGLLPNIGTGVGSGTAWTQGLILRCTAVTQNPNGTYQIQLTIATKSANLPPLIYISKYIPFVFSVPRATIPYANTSRYPENYKNYDSTGMFCLYPPSDGVFTATVGTNIGFNVTAAQLACLEQSAFPFLSIFSNPNQLVGLYCATPWRSYDFYNTVTTSSSWVCANAINMRIHSAYLYPKESAKIFPIKNVDLGGGMEYTEYKTTEKVPFMFTERGSNLTGVNTITLFGTIPMAVTPQLGGAFLACSVMGDQNI